MQPASLSPDDFRTDDSLGQLTVARKTEESQESNIVYDVLSASGVQYRHRNSDVITSRVAGKAEKHFVEVRVESHTCSIRLHTELRCSEERNAMHQL